MKAYILPSLKLTVVLIIISSVLYPLFIAGISKLTPGGGNGVTLTYNGKIVGYENIGQKFSDDKYFWGRPSAVDYNAAGSAGSNKGPSNRDYLATVKARIDTFLIHNPTIKKEQITSELVTASGSGLDPDISIQSAKIQVPRIAKTRNKSEEELYKLIDKMKQGPLLGFLGPEKINVLKLNIALNTL
ncbi:MAG TPA: K(+)-transporting ATPase subunit C [Bacteroidia bacterium]|jgi:K+-transporting ATPase ATPase C chain|nr:K(+)-transporting ATPase subunit C [Bacteroidia bacterium]